MSTAPNSLPLLWANCVDRLKDRVNSRSFWEALEATQPITIEDDTLIIGLDSPNFNLASHIRQTQAYNAVKNTVAELFGRPLNVRLIEGTTQEDWEATRSREQQAAAARAAEGVRREDLTVSHDSWEALIEQVARLYSTFANRSLPQVKARYANEALYAVAEAMDTLYPEPADDLTERSLARVLERIATVAEIPAPMLAFELERLRAYRSSQA